MRGCALLGSATYQLSNTWAKWSEEDFWTFFCVFLCTPGAWPFWPLRPSLEQLGKQQHGNASYQLSSTCAKWFLIRSFVNIFYACISMVQMQDPLGPGHSGTWDLHLNKLGKGPLRNATYQTSASEPSDSEEEDFEYFSMYFYVSYPGPPEADPHWTQEL